MSQQLSKTLQGAFSTVIFLTSVFIILTYFVSMGLGILVFFSTAEGLAFSRSSIALYPLFLADLEIRVVAGLFFLVIWWMFALCFAAAWKYEESLSVKLRAFFQNRSERLLSNNLLAMPLMTSLLLVVTTLLHELQSRGGVPTGGIVPGDPLMDFIRFSTAPLIEEAMFRIIPLGTFLATYIFMASRRLKPEFSYRRRLLTCIKAILQPERAKKLLGLKTIRNQGLVHGLDWAEWFMVLLSSVFFGVAHYQSGWGPGKISQATISGSVFALAYLYYGIQAPILLHWFFNYYFTVFDYANVYYSPRIGFAFFIVESANLFLGILLLFGIVVFLALTVVRMLRR